MQGKYIAIRDAIQHRSRLLARRRNVWLTLCPHLLGWRRDELYLVAFAATGTREWLCLPVAEIDYLRTTDGRWLLEKGSPPPPAEMELEVVVATSADPQAALATEAT